MQVILCYHDRSTTLNVLKQREETIRRYAQDPVYTDGQYQKIYFFADLTTEDY